MNEIDLKAQAFDDLKKLNGNPPYDEGGNIVRSDGYFAKSLVVKYGMSLTELERWSGYSDKRKKAEQARKAYEEAWE